MQPLPAAMLTSCAMTSVLSAQHQVHMLPHDATANGTNRMAVRPGMSRLYLRRLTPSALAAVALASPGLRPCTAYEGAGACSMMGHR